MRVASQILRTGLSLTLARERVAILHQHPELVQRPFARFWHSAYQISRGCKTGGSAVAKPLQLCIVGSGPAGFYVASQLLKTFGANIRITLLERLPTPFGLVRSGVAPDHPETKNVINQFTQLAEDARVSFYGNIRVGVDVSLSTLRNIYDGVVLAYGAESNRVLNIPGRHLERVIPAREFVWWYNGHPEHRTLPIDLREVERVSILGLGNVALDCARMLLQPPQYLQPTDVASHAMRQLQESVVQQVDIIGRRGPAQASFTAKELRELLRMKGIQVVVTQEDLALSEADEADLKASRARKRVYDLLKSASQDTHTENPDKVLHMHFFRSPKAIQAGELGRAKALVLEKTKLQPGRAHSVVPTGEYETLPADLVLESIGYRSLPLAGAPFDEKAGHIPNRKGRVVTSAKSDASVIKGLYVCGWVKRGPSGIIGTNLIDAAETVEAIAEDVQEGIVTAAGNSDSLLDNLQTADVQVVTFEDWVKIDLAERKAGEINGKCREKFVEVHQMLDACRL